MDEERHESDEQLRTARCDWMPGALLEAISDAIVAFGAELEILLVTDAFCALTGFTRRQLLGRRPPYPFETEADAEDRSAPLEAGDTLAREGELRHADGHVLATLTASRPARDPESGALLGYVATYRDVSEDHFQARLERALSEIVAMSAAGGEDQGSLADLVASKLAELLEAPAASVIRFEGEVLRVVGHSGDFPVPPSTAIDGGSNSARVALTGKSSRIDDYATIDSGIARALSSHGITGAVAVPIHMHGVLWGCIGAMTRRPGGFAANVEHSIERFTELISAALATAEDRARLRSRARLEEALREIAVASASGELSEHELGMLVADRVADLLGAAVATVFRFDPEWIALLGHHGRAPLPPRVSRDEPSTVAVIARTGKLVRDDDFRAVSGRLAASVREIDAVRSSIGVPVFLGGTLWGAITAGTAAAGGFPADTEQALMRLAELVSSSLANTQAQGRLRFRARFEEALRQIAISAASGELTDRELSQLVAEQLSQLLDAGGTAVVRFDGDAMLMLGASGPAALLVGLPVDPRSIVGALARTGTTVVSEDYANSGGAYDALARSCGARSAVAVPVRVGGRLWGSLSAMAAHGCYRGTFQDVSDQRRAEIAEAANRAKSEFLSWMSHELRTPLNAISGFSQLLAMDDLKPAQAENIGYVLRGAEHMLALVDEVLDLSRIEAGRLMLSSEAVNLADTVAEATALVAPMAHAASITIHTDAGGLAETGYVYADVQRLKQVLLNLLSNAVKYNRPGGRVDVSFAVLDSGRVRVSVTDTGIGIHPEQIAALFAPFERLGAHASGIEGTGLGLALSKGLIEAMGGTIKASSQPGIGTTFVIELDGVQAPEAQSLGRPSSDQRLLTQPSTADQQRGSLPRRPKILHIEDNVSNLRLDQWRGGAQAPQGRARDPGGPGGDLDG